MLSGFCTIVQSWFISAVQKKMKDYNFPKIPPKELKTVFKLWSPLALELLKEFLRFRPHKRITCTQALQHTYITDHKGLYTAQEAEHIVSCVIFCWNCLR